MRNILKRLTVLVFATLLAACGSGGPPHSDYFVVTFLPGMPAPTQEGLEALDNAARAAGRDRPSFIAVSGALPATGPTPALTQQRLDAIAKAFVANGVNPALMRIELSKFDAKAYVQHEDGFIVQLTYGTLQ